MGFDSKTTHYDAKNIEAIDIIEAYRLNFSLGNVIKYVLRAGKKEGNSYVSDLSKAMSYLAHEIKREINENSRMDDLKGLAQYEANA